MGTLPLTSPCAPARIDTTPFTCHDDPGALSFALPDCFGTEGAGGSDGGRIAGQWSLPTALRAVRSRPDDVWTV
jgi:hypothetical protein